MVHESMCLSYCAVESTQVTHKAKSLFDKLKPHTCHIIDMSCQSQYVMSHYMNMWENYNKTSLYLTIYFIDLHDYAHFGLPVFLRQDPMPRRTTYNLV